MAISNASDFKIYNEEFQAGYIETLQQFGDAFNGASNGAISLMSGTKLGDYEKEAFFTSLGSSLVSRQDITSNSSATPLKFAQDENVRVKIHRKVGPVDTTFKAFNMIGEDAQRQGSFLLGQSVAKAKPLDMLNMGLGACRAATANVSALTNDVTGSSGTCTYQNLLGTLRKFGDASNRIVAWVMHSTQWFDLGLDAVNNSVDSVVSNFLSSYTIPGFNMPFIVTDSSYLIDTTPTPDAYFVLGLTADAVQLIDSEEMNLVTDLVTGNEQLAMRFQGEYAYNLGVKGYKWDVTNGGANPTAANIATGSNWDANVTDSKDAAGVVLKCVAA